MKGHAEGSLSDTCPQSAEERSSRRSPSQRKQRGWIVKKSRSV
jgi:hypothetical protein